MKIRFIHLLIVFIGASILVSCGEPQKEGPKRPQVPEEQRTGIPETPEFPKVNNANLSRFAEMYNSGKYMILDARTKQDFDLGHLPEAIFLGYDTDNFDSTVMTLDTVRAYLIYSHKGLNSVKAMSKMNGKGFENIVNLIGGISQWRAMKYPWTK